MCDQPELDTYLRTASTIIAVISLTVVAWQTRSLARQSREVAKQTEVQTRTWAYAELSTSVRHLSEVYKSLLDKPSLWPYLRENKPLPRSGKRRRQVLIAAEMLADCIEVALGRAATDGDFKMHNDEWGPFAKEVYSSSEAIRVMVRKPYYHSYQSYLMSEGIELTGMRSLSGSVKSPTQGSSLQ